LRATAFEFDFVAFPSQAGAADIDRQDRGIRFLDVDQILSRKTKLLFGVELTAHNVSNLATPGYKRQLNFSDVVERTTYETGIRGSSKTADDFSVGKLIASSSKTDLALSGEGFFAVHASGQTLYTRNGQFDRGADGRLLTADGYALQAAAGGDLVVRGADFTVTAEGMVLEAGEPVGQVAVVQIAAPEKLTRAGGGLYSAEGAEVTPLATPGVRQGMLESSNVSMGDEMVVMMEAVRRAETGQRLVNVYDDLMGRVISSFGQA
jgi:flagellar basal body rod protein FlgG